MTNKEFDDYISLLNINELKKFRDLFDNTYYVGIIKRNKIEKQIILLRERKIDKIFES